jgi:hypothetical protein
MHIAELVRRWSIVNIELVHRYTELVLRWSALYRTGPSLVWTDLVRY